MVTFDSKTPYEVLGGEPWVQRFTARFYDLMDVRPEGRAARAIHPENLYDTRQKFYEFMTGWLGGPQLFVQRHGAPMLRARHLHASIGKAEIEAWLYCFRTAWGETVDNEAVTEAILPQIDKLARHMHNQANEATG